MLICPSSDQPLRGALACWMSHPHLGQPPWEFPIPTTKTSQKKTSQKETASATIKNKDKTKKTTPNKLKTTSKMKEKQQNLICFIHTHFEPSHSHCSQQWGKSVLVASPQSPERQQRPGTHSGILGFASTQQQQQQQHHSSQTPPNPSTSHWALSSCSDFILSLSANKWTRIEL